MAIIETATAERAHRMAVIAELESYQTQEANLWKHLADRCIATTQEFYRFMPIYVPWGKSIAHTKWWKRHRRQQRRGQR